MIDPNRAFADLAKQDDASVQKKKRTKRQYRFAVINGFDLRRNTNQDLGETWDRAFETFEEAAAYAKKEFNRLMREGYDRVEAAGEFYSTAIVEVRAIFDKDGNLVRSDGRKVE